MSESLEIEIGVKTVIVQIAKLKLGKDDVLVIRAPDDWRVSQIQEFSEALGRTAKYTKNRQLRRVLDRTMVMPAIEIEVVTAEPAGVSK